MMDVEDIRNLSKQQSHLARIDSIRHDHLNLEMIDSVSSSQSLEKDDTRGTQTNEISKTVPKKSHWKYIKKNVPLVLTQKDIQIATDPDHVTLSVLGVTIEQERWAKEIIKRKEAWSIRLSRVADWVCIGLTFIIILIHLFVFIFYLYKDREP